MFIIEEAKEADFDEIFALIRQNMFQLQIELGLNWDDELIKKHYRAKENWKIMLNNEFIGVVSLEWIARGLMIHTLQIKQKNQNSTIGYKVLKDLVKTCLEKNIDSIFCKVFNNNKAKKMYFSLGFQQKAEKNGILALQMNLKKTDNRVVKRIISDLKIST